MGISKSELPIFSKYPQRWAFFKCMLVDTNTTTNCGVFYEMWIGNIMQFECIKENSYRVIIDTKNSSDEESFLNS
jgi:hypothetical protein